MLGAAGVGVRNATLVETAGADAARALADGSLDFAFLIGVPDSPFIQSLFKGSLHIVSLARSEAVARHFPTLTPLVLPQGAVVDRAVNALKIPLPSITRCICCVPTSRWCATGWWITARRRRAFRCDRPLRPDRSRRRRVRRSLPAAPARRRDRLRVRTGRPRRRRSDRSPPDDVRGYPSGPTGRRGRAPGGSVQSASVGLRRTYPSRGLTDVRAHRAAIDFHEVPA